MENTTVKIIKVFNTSIENVFEAWTNSEQVAEWYGPEGMTSDVREMDAIEGGVYSITMKSVDGKAHHVRGKYRIVDSPNKIVMTWQWENIDASGMMQPESLVTVKFRLLDEDRTEVTLTHEGLLDEEDKKAHEEGWNSSFKKLEELFP
jgi:uncharacterized protein YndB with AHSA1/START domain